MRKCVYIIFAISLLTIACSQSSPGAIENTEIVVHDSTKKKFEKLIGFQNCTTPESFITKDLQEFGIAASIKAPKTVKIYKSVINDNEGERDYVVVHLVESINKKLEIIPTSYDMKTLLNNFELSARLYYKTTKLVVDSNSVVFESEHLGETQEFNKHVYNFLIRIELGGKAYFLTTDSHQEFTSEEYAYKKEDILKLYSIAKSIVEKR